MILQRLLTSKNSLDIDEEYHEHNVDKGHLLHSHKGQSLVDLVRQPYHSQKESSHRTDASPQFPRTKQINDWDLWCLGLRLDGWRGGDVSAKHFDFLYFGRCEFSCHHYSCCWPCTFSPVHCSCVWNHASTNDSLLITVSKKWQMLVSHVATKCWMEPSRNSPLVVRTLINANYGLSWFLGKVIHEI